MRRALLILAGIVALLFAVFVLPVVLLRWLPAPTTAFMLQSDTSPLRHEWVAADRIADTARRAVVAAEDQKFYTHRGFDVEAMQKAYANNQKKGRRVRGASTITQQTAKNLFLWPGGGYFRKGLEAIYTVLIEALWDKPRILTVYLNSIEFGPGIYGVEAAAQAFYGKPAAQLGAAEAARLAAVLPNPKRYSVARPGPYVQKRTGWILRQMGAGTRAVEPEPEEPQDDPAGEAGMAMPPLEPEAPPLETAPAPAAEPAPDPAAVEHLQQEIQSESQQPATPPPPP